MAVIKALVGHNSCAAVLLLCLLLLPCFAQDDGAQIMWGDDEDQVSEDWEQDESWVNDGEELTDLPADPIIATTPNGDLVLEFTPEVDENRDAVSLAREIVSRPEFDYTELPEQEGFLERLLHWLSSLPGLGSLGQSNWLFMGTLAAVLGLLAYLIVRITWGGLGRRVKGTSTLQSNGKHYRGAIDYLDEAEQAAIRRNYRDAVRFRFLAVLQQAGLPDNKLLTNSQVKCKLTNRNRQVEHPLKNLITGYEDAWYGGLTCNAETYSGLRLWAEQVERLIAEEKTA